MYNIIIETYVLFEWPNIASNSLVFYEVLIDNTLYRVAIFRPFREYGSNNFEWKAHV